MQTQTTVPVVVLSDGDTWDALDNIPRAPEVWILDVPTWDALLDSCSAKRHAEQAIKRIPLADLLDAYNEKHGTKY